MSLYEEEALSGDDYNNYDYSTIINEIKTKKNIPTTPINAKTREKVGRTYIEHVQTCETDDHGNKVCRMEYFETDGTQKDDYFNYEYETLSSCSYEEETGGVCHFSYSSSESEKSKSSEETEAESESESSDIMDYGKTINYSSTINFDYGEEEELNCNDLLLGDDFLISGESKSVTNSMRTKIQSKENLKSKEKSLNTQKINKESLKGSMKNSVIPPLFDIKVQNNNNINKVVKDNDKTNNYIKTELPQLKDFKVELKKAENVVSTSSSSLPKLYDYNPISSNNNKITEGVKLDIKPLKLPILYDASNNTSKKIESSQINNNNNILKMGKLVDMSRDISKLSSTTSLNSNTTTTTKDLNCAVFGLKCPRLAHIEREHHRFYDYIIPRFSKELKELKGDYVFVIPTISAFDDLFAKYGSLFQEDLDSLNRILAYHIILIEKGVLPVPKKILHREMEIDTLLGDKMTVDLHKDGTVTVDGIIVKRDEFYPNSILLTDSVFIPQEVQNKFENMTFQSKSTENIIKSNMFTNSSFYNKMLTAIKTPFSSSNLLTGEDDLYFHRELSLNTFIELKSEEIKLNATPKGVNSFKSFNSSDIEGNQLNKNIIDSPIMNIKIYDMEKIYDDYQNKILNEYTVLENENILLDYNFGFESTDLLKDPLNPSLTKYDLPLNVDILKEDFLNHIIEFNFNHPYEKDTYSNNILLFKNNIIQLDSNLYALNNENNYISILFKFNNEGGDNDANRLSSISINYDDFNKESLKFKDNNFDFDDITTTMHIDNDILKDMYSSNLEYTNFGLFLFGVSKTLKKAPRSKPKKSSSKNKQDTSSDDNGNNNTTSTTSTTQTKKTTPKKKGRTARFIQASKKKLKKTGQNIKKGGKYIKKKVSRPTKKIINKGKEKIYNKFQYETVPLNYKSGLTGQEYITGFKPDPSNNLPTKQLSLKIELLDGKNYTDIKVLKSSDNLPIFYISTTKSDEHILVYDVGRGLKFSMLDSNFIRVRLFNPISTVLENFEFKLSGANVKNNFSGEGDESLQTRKFLDNRLQFTFLFTDGELTQLGLWFKKNRVPSNYKSNLYNNYIFTAEELAFSKLIRLESESSLRLLKDNLTNLLQNRFSEISNYIYQYNITNSNNNNNNNNLTTLDSDKIDNLINYLNQFNIHIKSFANENNINLSLNNSNDILHTERNKEISISSLENKYKSYLSPKSEMKETLRDICFSLGSLDKDFEIRSKLAFDTIINEKNLNLTKHENKITLLESLNTITTSLLNCMLTIKEEKSKKLNQPKSDVMLHTKRSTQTDVVRVNL